MGSRPKPGRFQENRCGSLEASSRDWQGDKRDSSLRRIAKKKKNQLIIEQKIASFPDPQSPRRGTMVQGQFRSRRCSWHRPALTWVCPGGYFLRCNCKNKRSPIAWPSGILIVTESGKIALGGQFLPVILAMGLIFWIRDVRERTRLQSQAFCNATLFLYLDSQSMDSIRKFSAKQIWFCKRFWINDFFNILRLPNL